MYIMQNSWNLLHLFCGQHKEGLQELQMESSARGIFYVCPRKNGEERCRTKITQDEYQEILVYLSNLIIEAEMHGEVLDITNLAWNIKKRISCRVLAYETDKIHILVKCK